MYDQNDNPFKKRMGKFKESDAPDAKGKFKSLSPSGLASWLIKSRKGNPNKMKKSSALKKISAACKSAAKRKFKVWPSAYASGWGVRCTRAGGPSKFGGGKKKKK